MIPDVGVIDVAYFSFGLWPSSSAASAASAASATYSAALGPAVDL